MAAFILRVHSTTQTAAFPDSTIFRNLAILFRLFFCKTISSRSSRSPFNCEVLLRDCVWTHESVLQSYTPADLVIWRGVLFSVPSSYTETKAHARIHELSQKVDKREDCHGVAKICAFALHYRAVSWLILKKAMENADLQNHASPQSTINDTFKRSFLNLFCNLTGCTVPTHRSSIYRSWKAKARHMAQIKMLNLHSFKSAALMVSECWFCRTPMQTHMPSP